jgi:type I restriction enzyme M protein
LGTFFEAIVRTGFKQEKGQFFTHANIVRFILYALDLDSWAIRLINGASPKLPYIDDPACGSGTFLIEAMKLITHTILVAQKEKLKKSRMVKDYVQEWFQPTASNKNIHNRWAREFIYGAEDNEDLAMGTKVNMILHGDGNANIEKLDGLADFREFHQDKLREKYVDQNHPYKLPRNEQFDLVISNPPFSLKEEHRTIAIYSTRFAYAERRNSENLFIERWYQLLKEGGRMGVVLPDSVFDTNENLYIRMLLYRFFWIKAVVSLPQVTFQPYTPTKTSLLFAVKKTQKEIENWNSAWRIAAREYGKLRQSSVVQYILQNDQIRRSLIDLANRAEVEWYPDSNLISGSTLPKDIAKQIADSFAPSLSLHSRLAATTKQLEEFVSKASLEKLPADQAKESIARILRAKAPPNLERLSLIECLEAAYDDIVEAAVLNYTEDPKGENYCNAWWCFSEVTATGAFDYDIFFAEANHVGYKRTTRHPEGMPQPNDLFLEDKNGQIVINEAEPKAILDHLRSRNIFSDR